MHSVEIVYPLNQAWNTLLTSLLIQRREFLWLEIKMPSLRNSQNSNSYLHLKSPSCKRKGICSGEERRGLDFNLVLVSFCFGPSWKFILGLMVPFLGSSVPSPVPSLWRHNSSSCVTQTNVPAAVGHFMVNISTFFALRSFSLLGRHTVLLHFLHSINLFSKSAKGRTLRVTN